MTTPKPAATTHGAAPKVGGAAVKKSASRASSPAALSAAKSKANLAAQPAAAAVPAPAAALARSKPKLVRDSFTIPKSEYLVLDALKLRAAQLMRPTKKSEVLRAGIVALNAMDDKAFLSTINGVPSLKTGRPKATPAKPAAK